MPNPTRTRTLIVATALTTANAVLLTATYLWIHALRFNDGQITVSVNGVGEGWIEVAVFATAWTLTNLGLILVVTERAREPESWAVVDSVEDDHA